LMRITWSLTCMAGQSTARIWLKSWQAAPSLPH